MTRRTVWTPEMRKRVALMRLFGVPMKEIAAQVNAQSVGAVTLLRHRNPDEFPRGHLFQSLPPDVVKWLITITPDGASIADTVCSILVDAHADEQI